MPVQPVQPLVAALCTAHPPTLGTADLVLGAERLDQATMETRHQSSVSPAGFLRIPAIQAARPRSDCASCICVAESLPPPLPAHASGAQGLVGLPLT